MRRKELRVGTWNITGVGGREVELKGTMDTYKLDILEVTETWLKKGVEIEIPGFRWTGIAGDNKTRRGGRIGFQ